MKARDGSLNEKPSSVEIVLRAENEKLKAKVGELTMVVDVLKKMEDYGRQPLLPLPLCIAHLKTRYG